MASKKLPYPLRTGSSLGEEPSGQKLREVGVFAPDFAIATLRLTHYGFPTFGAVGSLIANDRHSAAWSYKSQLDGSTTRYCGAAS